MTWLLPLLLALLLPGPTLAQQAPIPERVPATPASTDTLPSTLDPAASRRLADALRDPKRREELLILLDALAATTPAGNLAASAAAPPAAPPASATPPANAAKGPALGLEPNSLGGQLVVASSGLLRRIGSQLSETYLAVGGLPQLAEWLSGMLADPAVRTWVAGALARLGAAVALGWLIAWLVQRALARVRLALLARAPGPAAGGQDPAQPTEATDALARAEAGAVEEHSSPSPPSRMVTHRAAIALGLFGLDLLAVLAFVFGAHLLLATPLAGTSLTQLVVAAGIEAITLWWAGRALLVTLAAPGTPAVRLLPLGDANAAYLVRWASRLLGFAFGAAAALEAASLLGLPRAAQSGWVKATSFLILAVLIGIVVHKRHDMRSFLAAEGPGLLAPLRRGLAPSWHGVAIVVLVLGWFAWISEITAGQPSILPRVVLSLLLLFLARLAANGVARWLEQKLAVDDALAERYPGIDARARTYQPLLRVGIGAVGSFVLIIAVAEIWGLAPIAWLMGTQAGRTILSGLASIGFTLVLALVVWEAINIAFARHLRRLNDASLLARSARLRTLLPMLRAAVLVVIVIFVAMTVLSELGVNIAPLLAGAGVLGIAIGVGSQKLVQDLITGLFLLLENAMQVGDVVTVAGVSGVVEDLSIRSIRLRAEDGAVHVIPFSAVTTVTNMTRDFSQAVIDAQVAYKDDYDHVVEVMRAIAAEMRADPAWQSEILADLEVMGLIRFDASGIIIRCRLRCLPFARWRVQREFHRRMKARFEQEGIEIPYPHQKLVMDDVTLPPVARARTASEQPASD
jgi:small-conductance mechanosensitive channel